MDSDFEREMSNLVANGFHQMNLKNFDEALQIFDHVIQNTTEIVTLLLAHQCRAICKTRNLDTVLPIQQISSIEDDLRTSLLILSEIKNSLPN
ncbi:MAG: hypothetical protein OXH39_10705 [Candidatus Poribacteria bacterium]|nr:hypothetical protein [Candidatus Poribacteria bacterium]